MTNNYMQQFTQYKLLLFYNIICWYIKLLTCAWYEIDLFGNYVYNNFKTTPCFSDYVVLTY